MIQISRANLLQPFKQAESMLFLQLSIEDIVLRIFNMHFIIVSVQLFSTSVHRPCNYIVNLHQRN